MMVTERRPILLANGRILDPSRDLDIHGDLLLADEMSEIGLLKAAGAIAFTQGAKSVTNAQVMRRALTYARDFDALIVHHTEDPDLVGEGVMNEGEFAARLGLAGIPNAAEA